MNRQADHFADYFGEGQSMTVPDGTCIFRPGDDTSAFLIVKSGTVRVEQTNNAGRTVVLYRVEAGDSCVLTTACLLAGKPYSGYGYAEGQMTGVAISSDRFRRLLSRDTRFQELVFQGFAARVGELTDVIDDLLEHRTDLRLARWLGTRPMPALRMTQQEVAQELGTAREVVSRTLKAFETRGWIKLGRGSLSILDAAALKRHGESEAM